MPQLHKNYNVLFYLERFQRCGVLKNVQLFGGTLYIRVAPKPRIFISPYLKRLRRYVAVNKCTAFISLYRMIPRIPAQAGRQTGEQGVVCVCLPLDDSKKIPWK